MELNKDPELIFLDDCIKFLADLNARTRLVLLEYDILKGILVPPSSRVDKESPK